MARASRRWIATEELRLGKCLVPVFVEQARPAASSSDVDGRGGRLHVVDGADRRGGRVGAQRIDTRAMRQVHVVDRPVQGRADR